MNRLEKRRNASKKGVVASIDAISAVLLALMFASMIRSVVYADIGSDDLELQLQRQAMDVLSVLEYSNAFNSPTTTLSETSSSICARLELYTGAKASKTHVYTKLGCPESSADEIVVWRTYIVGGEMKTAKLAIWFKV
jgi:hypothetical protein